MEKRGGNAIGGGTSRHSAIYLFTLMAAIASLYATAAFAETGVSESEIVVGISNAQSGPAQFLGKELSGGAKMYFDQVNKSGGVDGRMIRVIQSDDGYEPDRCIENTRKLINDDKVFLLFGYVGTPTSKAAVPITQREKVPYFFPFTGAGFLRDTEESSFVFNLRGTYDMETEAMVDYLVSKGKDRIAIFYQDDSYGRAGLSGTEKALASRNLALVARGTYQRNTTAVNKAVISIKKGKPQAVIMIGTYKPCAEFIKRARKMGMKDVDYLNISFVGSKALARELGPEGNGVIVTQVVPFPWNSRIPAVKEYQDVMKSSQMRNHDPGFVSLEGFLGAKLLVEILTRAGRDLSRESVISAAEGIRELDIGTEDRIGFSPEDHQGLERVFMTVIENGAFKEL